MHAGGLVVVLQLPSTLAGLALKQVDDWTPFPHQEAPEGDWRMWLLRGGRGSGKTEGGARYVLKHLRQHGHAARIGVGAPTIQAAREVCAEGKSGIITMAPAEFIWNRSLMGAFHKAGG